MTIFRKLLEDFDRIVQVNEGIDEVEEFEQCMAEISDLLDQAFSLLPRGSITARRAESYWYNTMKGCIDGQATMTPMSETLSELQELSDEEDDEYGMDVSPAGDTDDDEDGMNVYPASRR